MARLAPASTFGFQNLKVPFQGRGIGMFFRVSRNTDFKRRNRANGANELGCRLIALPVRTIIVAQLRHVAAQGHDVANAGIPVIADDGNPRPRAGRLHR